MAKKQDLPQLAPIGPRATPKLLCALQNQLAIGQQFRRALDTEPVLFEAAAFKAQGAKGLRPCWGIHGGSLRMDSMPGFGAARDHLPDRMRNLQDLTPTSPRLRDPGFEDGRPDPGRPLAGRRAHVNSRRYMSRTYSACPARGVRRTVAQCSAFISDAKLGSVSRPTGATWDKDTGHQLGTLPSTILQASSERPALARAEARNSAAS